MYSHYFQNNNPEHYTDAVLARMEAEELAVFGRLEAISEKLEFQREINFSFRFPSNYSHMRLLLCSTTNEANKIVVVEKVYGMKAGSEGHEMLMTKEQATLMAGYVKQYFEQLNHIGVNLPFLYDVSPIALEDDHWGVRMYQDFVKGPNFVDVWNKAVEKGDKKIMKKLVHVLLETTKKVTDFKKTDDVPSHVFPYSPTGDGFDSITGIDLKPHNYMIDIKDDTLRLTFVDIVYPTMRLEDGCFSFLNALPGSDSLDPGWKHLPERLANKRGLYTKIILELAGTLDGKYLPEVLPWLEKQVLAYVLENESKKVYEYVDGEVKSKYEKYQTMCGRGEKIRFSKIFS